MWRACRCEASFLWVWGAAARCIPTPPAQQAQALFPWKQLLQRGWATARSCPESLLGLQNGKLASQGSHLFCKGWERLNRFGANELGRAPALWWEEAVSRRQREDALGRSETVFKTQVLWRRSVELSSASLVVPADTQRWLASAVFCV